MMVNIYEYANDLAINMVDDLVQRAEKYLDKKYGDGFSKENPQIVLQLSMIYATYANITYCKPDSGGYHG